MEMGKKIYVDFPESKIRVVADLCEETEPEMCEILWNTIKDQPLRMACMHTMSTGHFFDAKIRPSASPVKSGTQANPVGRHKWFLCDLKPGQMLYRIVADEFVIVDFMGGTVDEACALYVRIRQQLQQFVEDNHYEVVFTISGGI